MSLNALIDKGKTPKEVEYILVRHQHHYLQKWADKSIIIPAGTVVVDVRIRKAEHWDFLGYDFKVKETGFESHTNYPWILAENTPENLEILKQLALKEQELDALKTVCKSIQKSLKTLEL